MTTVASHLLAGRNRFRLSLRSCLIGIAAIGLVTLIATPYFRVASARTRWQDAWERFDASLITCEQASDVSRQLMEVELRSPLANERAVRLAHVARLEQIADAEQRWCGGGHWLVVQQMDARVQQARQAANAVP